VSRVGATEGLLSEEEQMTSDKEKRILKNADREIRMWRDRQKRLSKIRFKRATGNLLNLGFAVVVLLALLVVGFVHQGEIEMFFGNLFSADVTTTTDGCQEIRLNAQEGLLDVPTIGVQPSSWCPSDLAIWQGFFSEPASQKWLADLIVRESAASVSLTFVVEEAIEVSLSTGVLSLPGTGP